MKKLTIISIMVLAFLTLTKNASAQNFKASCLNSTSCVITIEYLDASYNVIEQYTCVPGPNGLACTSGTCVYVKIKPHSGGALDWVTLAISGSTVTNYSSIYPCGGAAQLDNINVSSATTNACGINTTEIYISLMP